MKYKTIVATPAHEEPISMNEAYRQLRVEPCVDDEHIAALISISRDKAERFCNRYFSEQVVKIVYDGGFSGSSIDLPYPDLISVDSITYVDSSNAQIEIDASEYVVLLDNQVIYANDSFPSDAKGYTVTVTTGAPTEFGGAKVGMMMMLTDLYELRSESVVGFSVNQNPAVMASLWPYRVNLGV